MRELLIATRNRGKVFEIRHALADVPICIVDANDVSALAAYEPEETGATFEENAILKARAYATRAGILALADDSGIEVDALRGAPGVRSARYAPGSDEDRMRALLKAMEAVPDAERGAQYRCVVAMYDPANGKESTREGTCRGHVLREPRGSGGFGYDPIFYCDEAGKGMAELSLEEKERVSHRGRALRRAREVLLTEFA